MLLLNNKKGQLTVFIIVAVVIAAVLIIFFFPQIKMLVYPSTPEVNFKDCVKGELKTALELMGNQGGSIKPVHYIMYGGNKVEYLCYTNEYYKMCMNQQPMLKNYIERELNLYLQPKLQECVNALSAEMEADGYVVNSKKVELGVSLIMGNVKVNVNSPIVFQKGDEAIRFSSYSFNIPNKIYDLLMIANSILNWEAQYGDADTTTYMFYYPNLKVEKYKQGDGSKIYILTDRLSNYKFMFASRSLSWPPGYGYGMYVTT